jgi:hypothetical protein
MGGERLCGSKAQNHVTKVRGANETKSDQDEGSCPVPFSSFDWLQWVNEPQTEKELEALRLSVDRGKPFGQDSGVRQ